MFNTTFSPYKNRLQLHTQFPLKLNTFLNPPRNHLIVHIKKSNFQDLFTLFTILPIWKFDLNKNYHSHSVEMSWFFYHTGFTWNQFWGFLKCKICHFNKFRGSEIWFLWIFSLLEGWNLPKWQNSKPLKLQKWQF